MIDFKNAFEEGQKAAKKTVQAKKEITSLFEELNKQIHEISTGKIKIELRQFNEDISIQEMLKNPFPDIRKYTAIVAVNPTIKNSPVKELGRWHQDREGYPCKIIISGDTKYCENKEALENALGELLKNPFVAEQLLNIMKMEAHD